MEIHQKLVSAGYRSLIAGGAVRDLLLDEVPNDLDIATNATPDQVEELFEKTVMVGKAFGVSRVILMGQDIEVATFRKDGPYKDGRHPESIQFSSDKEDALRRDFTINAMFYDVDTKEVIDYVGGQKDLMKRVIRTVGKPTDRFGEDKLRILRALRFQSQLGFSIEKETQEAVQMWRHKLDQVSMERVRDEWGKLLKGQNRLIAIEKCHELKVFQELFPNWNYQPLFYSRVFGTKKISLEKLWSLWSLMHVTEKREELAAFGIHWKLPRDRVKQMIFSFDQQNSIAKFPEMEPVDIAIFMGSARGDFAVDMYKSLVTPRPKKWEEAFDKAMEFFKEGFLPLPVVNGDDLIQFGMSPGPKLAEWLRDIYRYQLKDGVTHKEELMKTVTLTKK